MTTCPHDYTCTHGHVIPEKRAGARAPGSRGPRRPVTVPEEWRINLGQHAITHIKSGLVLKMRKGFQRGELVAFPMNPERMPRWGTRWPRALREAEALYHAAVAAHHKQELEEQGEGA